MNEQQDQQPTMPFQKANGEWTFYIYPKRVRKEAGQYPDRDAAYKAFNIALHHWVVNGQKSGDLPTIVDQ